MNGPYDTDRTRFGNATRIFSFQEALFSGKSYFADFRMTFRQNFFLQDLFRNKLGVDRTVALLRLVPYGFVTLRPAK